MSTALEPSDFMPLPEAFKALADMGLNNKRSHLYSLVREGLIPTERFAHVYGVRRSDLPEIAETVAAISDRRKRVRTSSAIAANPNA